jgi:hypothetical protein
MFVEASGDPGHSGIAEDAISWVEVGCRGGFGLVLGVDQRNAGALVQNGANWVIHDFANITAEQVVR